jgi:hypothetical protein
MIRILLADHGGMHIISNEENVKYIRIAIPSSFFINCGNDSFLPPGTILV